MIKLASGRVTHLGVKKDKFENLYFSNARNADLHSTRVQSVREAVRVQISLHVVCTQLLMLQDVSRAWCSV